MSGISRDLSGAMESARRSASQSVTKLKSGFGGAPEYVSQPAANEGAAPAARPESSVISANTELKGSVTTTDELYIQGKIEGNVSATAVTVCEGGVVFGDITAGHITVHGVVTGNISGGHVQLCTGATVDGEIRHNGLRIDAGANFEGSIKRAATAASVAAE